MTGIHQGLYAFWSQFSYGGKPIPAYLQGHVPEDAAFPYITFDVASGRAFATSVVTATVWCRAESGINVNAQRASIMDSIDCSLENKASSSGVLEMRSSVALTTLRSTPAARPMAESL